MVPRSTSKVGSSVRSIRARERWTIDQMQRRPAAPPTSSAPPSRSQRRSAGSQPSAGSRSAIARTANRAATGDDGERCSTSCRRPPGSRRRTARAPGRGRPAAGRRARRPAPPCPAAGTAVTSLLTDRRCRTRPTGASTSKQQSSQPSGSGSIAITRAAAQSSSRPGDEPDDARSRGWRPAGCRSRAASARPSASAPSPRSRWAAAGPRTGSVAENWSYSSSGVVARRGAQARQRALAGRRARASVLSVSRSPWPRHLALRDPLDVVEVGAPRRSGRTSGWRRSAATTRRRRSDDADECRERQRGPRRERALATPASARSYPARRGHVCASARSARHAQLVPRRRGHRPGR